MSATNILQAVDIITTSKIQKLKFDKTIVATIKHVLDIDVGEYRAEYEAGTFKVYAEDPNIVYAIGQSVYVKIPEGDYSNKKFIEGLVANEEVAKKALDLSQIKIYANQKFILDRNGKQWKIDSDEFKQYIRLYSTKENGFIKLTAKFSGQSNTTENYGLKGNGVWALSVLDMNGTPFNKPNGAYDSAYLKELNEYKDGLILNFVDGNKSFVCEEVHVEFGEVVDFSTTPYYLIVNAPNGIDGDDILLEGHLYGEGKDITDTISIFQWYEEVTGETDIDAGFGWKKLEGETASTLKVTAAGQKQYKLVAFYEENKSVSQTITVNPTTGFITVDENGNVTHSEGKVLSNLTYYNPNGDKLDKFRSDYPYLIVKATDSVGNIYTTTWKAQEYSQHISFIGNDLFHYNANSDISAAIANQEYTLEAKYLEDDQIVSVSWQMAGEDSDLSIDTYYNPENSMMKNIWVNPNGILHYTIKDTYAIQNWNNTFRVKIKTIDKEYTSLKEIYFIKDGQQGTNGTEYCCIVRPVAADGVTPLSDAEAILTKTDSIKLKAFVYKNSKLIEENNISYYWYGQSECLKVDDDPKQQSSCIITHNAISPIVPNLHIVTLQTIVNSGYIYFNYPLSFYNGDSHDILELSYSKYVEYTASGVSPEWLDKSIVCKDINNNNWSFVSNNTDLIKINKNKIIPSSTFDFSNGIGVLESGNLYCPVMMYLNTFGNEAINGWDGTSLQLDNNKGTVLAPQIGAGKKDSKNQFTGVIMGKDYTEKNQIGLYGYQEGTLSFGLNQDGTAFFGQRGQGQIIIDGTSGTISGWNINPSSLSAGDTILKADGTIECEELIANNTGSIGGWEIDTDQLSSENNETILSKINGITTNLLQIKEGVVTYGQIGQVGTSESGGALGIQGEGTVVLETPKDIRISGKKGALNERTYIHADHIEVGKNESTVLIAGKNIIDIIDDLQKQINSLQDQIDNLEPSNPII